MRMAVTLGTCCVLALSLGTCSSYKTGVELRKEGYDEIARSIKPGMHRRQLYALLPPMRKPVADPPFAFPIHSLPGPSVYQHRERHELDEECHLIVHYQLKDEPEHTYRRAKKPAATTPESIDALLAAITLPSPSTPSKENPNDIIVHISRTFVEPQRIPDSTEPAVRSRRAPLPAMPFEALAEPPSRKMHQLSESPLPKQLVAHP
jgi:hypothetical protein